MSKVFLMVILPQNTFRKKSRTHTGPTGAHWACLYPEGKQPYVLMTGLLARLPSRRLPIHRMADSGIVPVRSSDLQLQEKPRIRTWFPFNPGC
jgi:hypothetical protein